MMLNRLKSYYLKYYTLCISRIKHIGLGEGAIIYPGCYISNKNKSGGIVVNAGTRIGCFAKDYSVGFPNRTRIISLGLGKITIGKFCEINGANICAKCEIAIGDKVQIASGVQIADYNAHEVYSYNRKSDRDNPVPVLIGNNVWIGLNAIILKGSIIGDNCVVAAGSVVKGEFPPYTIVQGNPAVAVKHLLPERFKL